MNMNYRDMDENQLCIKFIKALDMEEYEICAAIKNEVEHRTEKGTLNLLIVEPLLFHHKINKPETSKINKLFETYIEKYHNI